MLVEEDKTLERLFKRYMDDVDVIVKNDFDDAVKEINHTPFQAVILNTPEDAGNTLHKNRLEKLPLGTPVFSCWVPGNDEVARQLGVVKYP